MKTWQDPYSYPEKEQPLLDLNVDYMGYNSQLTIYDNK